MTPNSALLTIHVSDLPEVTRHAQSLMRRIESLEEENELLRARVAELEADRNGADGAATKARLFANSLMNRRG